MPVTPLADRDMLAPFLPPGTALDLDVTLDFLELPLLLKVGPRGGGAYLPGGLSVGMNVRAELATEFMGDSSTADMGEATEDAEFSVVVGAGISAATVRRSASSTPSVPRTWTQARARR